jgi:hypothetical protein
MKKFLVLYKASEAGFAQAMSASPEQQQAGMGTWMAWMQNAGPALVDGGAPLGKTLRVTSATASPSRNDIGGYSIMQGESKEAVAAKLKDHPHFNMQDGFIEVIEIMPIPGM